MRITHLFVSLATVLALAPSIAAARVVNLESGAIGVTEADYFTLKDSHCYLEQSDAPSDAIPSAQFGILCDPLLARLAGQIIFRAEHYGEMYRVNDADGLNSLVRYLPDGLYEANGKFYWVSEGYRTRLTTTDAYRRVLLTAQRTPDYVTYVDSRNMDHVQEGRVVVLVDQGGSLAYIGNTLGDVRTFDSNDELVEILEDDQVITSVKRNVIKKLPLNNDWQ